MYICVYSGNNKGTGGLYDSYSTGGQGFMPVVNKPHPRATPSDTVCFLPWIPGTVLLENVEHCGGEPEQAANMHMNRRSFTLKWRTESVAFMSVVYAQPFNTWSDLNLLCIILYGLQAACHWWSVRSCCDKQEVRCHASLNLNCLRYSCQRCTPAVAQHCHASGRGHSIFGKYLNVHLKFTVYGRKHGRIHTHVRNAVPLVWGSLRLAPITYNNIHQ